MSILHKCQQNALSPSSDTHDCLSAYTLLWLFQSNRRKRPTVFLVEALSLRKLLSIAVVCLFVFACWDYWSLLFQQTRFFLLRRDKFWDACCTLTRLVEMYMVRIGVDNQNVYQWKRKHSVRLSDYGGSTDDIGDRTRKQRWEDRDLSTDLMGGPSSNYFPNTTVGFVQRFYDASFDVPKENKNLKRTQHPCNLILA